MWHDGNGGGLAPRCRFDSVETNVGLKSDFYKLKELTARDVAVIDRLFIAPLHPQLQDLNRGWIALFNLIFGIRRMFPTGGGVAGE